MTATVSIRRHDGTGARVEVTSDEVLQPFPVGVTHEVDRRQLAADQ